MRPPCEGSHRRRLGLPSIGRTPQRGGDVIGEDTAYLLSARYLREAIRMSDARVARNA
jgi:hypothetical protein